MARTRDEGRFIKLNPANITALNRNSIQDYIQYSQCVVVTCVCGLQSGEVSEQYTDNDRYGFYKNTMETQTR